MSIELICPVLALQRSAMCMAENDLPETCNIISQHLGRGR